MPDRNTQGWIDTFYVKTPEKQTLDSVRWRKIVEKAEYMMWLIHL